MDDLGDELKTCFLDEASQHLDDCEKCFLDLERDKNNPDAIMKIFRLVHNLKGTARSVGFAHITDFTHELESLLIKFKNKVIEIDDASVSLLLECNDHMRMMIAALRQDFNAAVENPELFDKLKKHVASTAKPPPPQAAEVHPVSTAAVETHQPIRQAQPIPEPSHKPAVQHDESIRVSLERLEKLNNFVGELVILQAFLSQNSHHINSVPLLRTISQLSKITKEVQGIAMACRMVPLKATFQKLQRLARDTSVSLEKLIDLDTSGEDTEVDKTVIEHLSDPLVHLIRNAVDHGLESTSERIAAGKPERGNLRMSAYHQGDHLVFEIQDDGRGLDEDLILAKAVEQGLVPAQAALTSSEIQELIFHAGFSTKAEVSEISGRGVGLDVVKKNIERLSGEIFLESEEGKGTLFRVHFPLTLAITEGMVVMIDNERFVVPLAQVFETVRPEKSKLNLVTGRGEVLNLREETIPLFHLSDLLELKGARKQAGDCLALVIRDQKNSFAVLVDEIIRQQQVVIKQVGPEIRDRQGFLGSAILGDGQPVMILDLHYLVKSRFGTSRPVRQNENRGVAS